MLAGTLYVSTPLNRVLALDAATGATRWTFDPRIKIAQQFASLAPGTGTGSVCIVKTSGPPKRSIAIALILSGTVRET